MYCAIYFDADTDIPKSQNITKKATIELKYAISPNCFGERKVAKI